LLRIGERMWEEEEEEDIIIGNHHSMGSSREEVGILLDIGNCGMGGWVGVR
jgi:hypothetical protein